MLKNYFITAIRHIKGDKGYSLINILGLSIGLTCFIIFYFSWQYENSFDKFHKNADNIYQVTGTIKYAGMERDWVRFNNGLAEVIKGEIPDVQAAANLDHFGDETIIIGNNSFKERVSYVDETIYDVLTINIVKAQSKRCMDNPQAVLLSESMASKYFDSENPIGKSIKIKSGWWEGVKDFIIMGIIKDLPSTSSFKMNIICSAADMKKYYSEIYTVIHNKESLAKIETGIENIIKSKFLNEDNANITPTKIKLKPLLTRHLADERITKYLLIFGTVAFVILLLSCINYINLSVGLAIKRIKELGIRKTLGSGRADLITQYLIKSVLSNFIALLIALLLTYLIISNLPYSNLLREINFRDIADYRLMAGIFGIFVFVTLLSGAYPAFYISGLNPISLFSKVGSGLKKRGTLNSAIIFIQFTALTVFIILSFGISKQLSFLENADYGFKGDNVFLLGINDTEIEPDMIKNEFRKNKHIKSVSCIIGSPLSFGVTTNALIPGNEGQIPFTGINADTNFLKTFSIPLIEGRNFTDDDDNFKGGRIALINETAAKMFVKGSAVGQTLTMLDLKGKLRTPCHIVGVVKDFHSKDMHYSIGPTIIRFSNSRFITTIAVKMDDEGVKSTVDYIKSTFSSLFPNVVADYSFADERIGEVYESEFRLGSLSKIFTALSIILSVMGLFGLTALSTERRKKEIGIRKVLGASINELIITFVKDVRLTALAANIVAIPIGLLLLNKWYESFAYKESVPYGYYSLIIMVPFVIALVTIGVIVLKAAKANPVDSLRNE